MEDQRVFEMISVWFANTYYISIYNKSAEDFHNGNYPSFAKAYRYQVEYFNTSLRQAKNPDGSPSHFYPKIMSNINNQYNEYLRINNTPSQFIDMVARCMVPPDEYAEIYHNEHQKREVVKAILLQSVATFTVYILNEAIDDVLSLEIRNAKNPNLQQQQNKRLKDKFVSIINQKKNEYCALLVAGRNGVDITNPEARAMIPQEIVGRLEEKIRYLVEEKSAIIREKNELIRSQNGLVKQMRALVARCRELEIKFTLIQKNKKKSPTPQDSDDDDSRFDDNNPIVNKPPPGFFDESTSVAVQAQKQSQPEALAPLAPEELSSVKDMKNTKYQGINLIPEQIQNTHNTDNMDEIPAKEFDDTEMSEDGSGSESENESENEEDNISYESLNDDSDMSVSDDE